MTNVMPKASTVPALFLTLTLFPFVLKSQSAGDYRSNTTSGNWATSASWETYNGSAWVAAADYPGQNAGAGLVTIRNGHTITIDLSIANAIGALTVGEGSSGALTTSTTANRTLTITNDLTITANGSYNLMRTVLTVNGNTEVYGSITDGNSSGSSIFVGTFTIHNGGSFSTANNSAITFRGGIVNDGTFNKTGTGAVTFDTNDQEISGSQPIVMNGTVTVNGINLVNNSADLSLTRTTASALTGTGNWEQGENSVLKFHGASMDCSVDFSTNVNTVNYARSGTQTVYQTTYSNLTISGSGTKTLDGAIDINGNLTISGTATLACDIHQITGNASGTFTMGSGTGLTLGNTADVTEVLFPTGFTSSNITLNSASTVTYQSSAAQTVSTITSYGNLTIAGGGTKTIGGNVTIAGNLTVSAGTFDLGTSATSVAISGNADIAGTLSFNGTTTKSVTISGSLSGAGTIDMSGGSRLHSLTLSGASNSIGTLTTAAVASTITYNSTSDQQVFASDNYRNLVISANSTKTLQGSSTVNNDFTINSTATFNPAGQDLSVNGNTTIAGTFADGTAAGTTNLNDVDLSGGTIHHASQTGVVNISGNLTMPTGNGVIGRVALTVTGTTTVATGRSLTLNDDNGTKTFIGAVTVNGTGTWTSTSVTTAANLEFRGGITNNNSSSTFSAGGATFSTNSQNLAGAGAFSFANSVSIAGAVIITNQSSHANGVTFSGTLNGTDVSSRWKNDPNTVAYYQPSVATQPMSTGLLDVSESGNYFYYSRGGDQNVKVPVSSYYHLYISGDSGTKTLQGNTSVSANLNIGSSTTLNAAAYNLSVTGTTTLNGTMTDNDDSGTNTFTGLVTVSSTGSLSAAGNSPFVFEGGITNNGTFSKTGTGAVSFSTNNQNIDGTAAMTLSGAVTIGAGITVTYKNTNASGLTLNGVLNGTNGSSTWKNNASATVKYQPGVSTEPMSTGILDVSASGNTFSYSDGGAQTIRVPASAYHHLTLSGSGTKSLAGDITVNGNLTLSSATLDVVSGQNYGITVKGNWVNTSGTFQARSGTVTLNGSSDQQITSNANSFYNLVIANEATQVSLNDNLTVTNLLTLNDGVITTGSYRVIISNSSSTALTGYSSGSFINGNLRRYIATNTSTYAFPVGNGTGTSNYYRADIINNNLEGITYIDARFKPLTGHNDSELNVSDNWGGGYLVYTTINTAGVWELEPTPQPTGGLYDIKLYIANMSGFTDNNFGPLKRPVGSTSGADWETGGGLLNNNDTPGRTVSSGYMYRRNLVYFSEFGGGSGSGSGQGLPIELVSFTAVYNGREVKISWTTASETNNDFFTVERSADARYFEELGRFEAVGNSSQTNRYFTVDRTPLPGISYYRLKQTDNDGKYTYSDVVAVEISSAEPVLAIYTNSLSGRTVTVSVPANICKSQCDLKITDVSGRSIALMPAVIGEAQQSSIQLPHFVRPGLYFISLHDGSSVIRQKMIVR